MALRLRVISNSLGCEKEKNVEETDRFWEEPKWSRTTNIGRGYPTMRKAAKWHFYCDIMLVAQSCPTLCHPTCCSPPGSSLGEILQTRMLERVAIPFSRVSFQTRDRSWVSWISGRFFAIWVTKKVQNQCYLSTDSGSRTGWLWVLRPREFAIGNLYQPKIISL